MKIAPKMLPAVLLPALLSLSVLPVSANELADLTKSAAQSATKQVTSASQEQTKPLQTNAMISYAAEQLNLSESTVSAGFGSLLKVAKDNLSGENFAMISKVIPDLDSYLSQAPEVAESKNSLNSLLSNAGDAGKKAESLQYLNSAFEKIGIPKEQAPVLVNTLNGYLQSNGYGQVATYLEKGLSFL
ncbi:DUF2780 domain-containing protein [Colwellia sp. D2M02]|uniref:DUF2780 domain-containing protein n=1 Tax=Colwellia sp. D2M02 TaxID=2841562 RepID=UPI001C095783|nr:DUF2780 domain-containing protein [Colwellia sp. D2M02]MBU2893268.1 DUF2780 domain-containing protein [Colwellia sp. D2M02]